MENDEIIFEIDYEPTTYNIIIKPLGETLKRKWKKRKLPNNDVFEMSKKLEKIKSDMQKNNEHVKFLYSPKVQEILSLKRDLSFCSENSHEKELYLKNIEVSKHKVADIKHKELGRGLLLLDCLNERQKEFILISINEGGKLLGIPGGGKSTCIIERIKYNLLTKELPSSQSFLVLTFSKAASVDFREKANSKNFNTNNIRTIHSLAGKMLSCHNSKKINGQSRIQSMDTVVFRASTLLQDVLSDRDPNRIQDFLRIHTYLGQLRSITIDEAQDISSIQYEFTKHLSSLCQCALVLVGDPNQNIFGFQNGSSKHLLEHPGFVVQLIENYRSTKQIVNIINESLPLQLHNDELMESSMKQESDDATILNNDKVNANDQVPKLFIGEISVLRDYILSIILDFQSTTSTTSTTKKRKLAIIGPVKNSVSKYGTYKSFGLNTIANELDMVGIKFKKHYSDSKSKSSNSTEEKKRKGTTKGTKDENDNENEVILTTIHSSKGLEYDFVILLNYHFWTQNRSPRKEDLHSLKCLWYVALSRAKYNMFVFTLKNCDIWPWYDQKLLPAFEIQLKLELKKEKTDKKGKNKYKNMTDVEIHEYLQNERFNSMNVAEKKDHVPIPDITKLLEFNQMFFAYVDDVMEDKTRLTEDKTCDLENIVYKAFFGKNEEEEEEEEEEEGKNEDEDEDEGNEEDEDEDEEDYDYFDDSEDILENVLNIMGKENNNKGNVNNKDNNEDDEKDEKDEKDDDDTENMFQILPSYGEFSMFYGLWAEDTISYAYRRQLPHRLVELKNKLSSYVYIERKHQKSCQEVLTLLNSKDEMISYKMFNEIVIPYYTKTTTNISLNTNTKEESMQNFLYFLSQKFKQKQVERRAANCQTTNGEPPQTENQEEEKEEEEEEEEQHQQPLSIFCYFDHMDRYFDYDKLQIYATELENKVLKQEEELSILDLFILNLFHYQFSNYRRSLWLRKGEEDISHLYVRYANMSTILKKQDKIIRTYAKSLPDGYVFQYRVNNPILPISGVIDAINFQTMTILEFKFSSESTKQYLARHSAEDKIKNQRAFYDLQEYTINDLPTVIYKNINNNSRQNNPNMNHLIQVFGYAEFFLCKNSEDRLKYEMKVVHISETIHEISGCLKYVSNQERFQFHEILREAISTDKRPVYYNDMIFAYDFETTGLFNYCADFVLHPKIMELHVEEVYTNLVPISTLVKVDPHTSYDEKTIEQITGISRQMCNEYGISEEECLNKLGKFFKKLDSKL